MAVAIFLCGLPATLQGQGHARSVVCDKGDGKFEAQFGTDIRVYAGPSMSGDFEARSCSASITWNKQVVTVASDLPEVDVDALGIDVGLGTPVAAFQVSNKTATLMTYEIYSLRKAPHLLKKITGGDFFRSADTDMDGRVEIWAEDAGALEGFDGLPLGEFEFAPTIVLRFEKSRLMDVSAEFQSSYDQQIARVKQELSEPDLADFKNSDGKTLTGGGLTAARQDQLKLTKARVLEIVWAYLYSGREKQAWAALADMWPSKDADRAQAAITGARGHGIRAQIDGTVSDPSRDESKKRSYVYDTPNSVQESEISPAVQNSRVGEAAPMHTKTQDNPVSDTTPQAILLRLRALEGDHPVFPQGGEVLDMVIDSAGKVESIQAVGDAVPGVAAASATWKFIPAFKNGRAVASRMRMAVSLGE
ncbi:MAG TPA: hypothetical protein VIY69_13655 [Candidatus Acidoferrales bacterium]